MAKQRRQSWLPLVVLFILLAVAIASLVFYYRSKQPRVIAPPGPAVSSNLLLGNPSGATADPSNRNNYLMDKGYFVLSYNNARGTPNWVSWRLTQSDLGSARANAFSIPMTPCPPASSE